MSRHPVIGLVLAAGLFAAVMQGCGAAQAPEFTQADEAVIANNEALVRLRASNPEGLRRILDALAMARTRQLLPRSEAGRAATSPDGTSPPFDPARNPDLVFLQRASPEAAHDLFQLLKQAARQK